MIEQQRKVEKDDWSLVKAILCEECCDKEAERKIAYFQKLNKLKDCAAMVGLIGCNIVSFFVIQERKIIEKFVTKDWQL